MDSKIRFICSCGLENTKGLRSMVKYAGAKCNKCSKLIQVKKAKDTFIEKYGCDNPNKNIEVRKKTTATIMEKYGTEHAFQAEEVKQRIKETVNGKYGVNYATQNKDVIAKIKNTCIQRYGVECSAQNPDIKEKIIKTTLERYGVECSFKNEIVKQKIKDTLKEKYGVTHNFQSGELRDKRKETFIKKYGVEHPAQSSEIMEKAQKNAKKYKEYKMPSGEIRKVQGYEPFALDTLLKTYTEDQIKTDRKDVPRIQYEVESKKKYYFPDIFIPHENKLIEVKSTWTYKCKTDNIHQKTDACKAQGYNYEIWCFDAKGNRVEI